MTDKKTDKEYIEFKEAVIKYAMDKKLYSKEENNFAPTRMMLRDGSVKNLTRLQDIYEHLVERYGYGKELRRKYGDYSGMVRFTDRKMVVGGKVMNTVITLTNKDNLVFEL